MAWSRSARGHRVECKGGRVLLPWHHHGLLRACMYAWYNAFLAACALLSCEEVGNDDTVTLNAGTVRATTEGWAVTARGPTHCDDWRVDGGGFCAMGGKHEWLGTPAAIMACWLFSMREASARARCCWWKCRARVALAAASMASCAVLLRVGGRG